MIRATGINTGKPIYFWPWDVQLICACPDHPGEHTLISFQNGNAIEVRESIEEIAEMLDTAERKEPWEK